MDDHDTNVYNLGVETELRFVVAEDAEVTLQLLSGLAEIFGSEVIENRPYVFSAFKSVSVFTWRGCTIKLTGRTENVAVSTDTMVIIPVNLHACLEEMRVKAEAENSRGPITLVVGPMDSGKSSMCRTLLNYAARLGRKPVFIDLDVGQTSVSVPGTVTVLPVKGPADISDGFNQQDMSVYPFGYKSPGHNIVHYFLLIKKLGQMVHERLRRASENIRASGIIIDTCGWVRGYGYQAITLAAFAFEIDVLFVIEEERLFLQLKRDMPNCVKVVYVPKQDGAHERIRPIRTRTRDNLVYEYFYGTRTPLNPFTFSVKFSDMQIYKVKQVNAGATVYAQNVNTSDVTIAPVSIAPNLINQIVSLSFSETVDENIMFNNIIGFVCILNVDKYRKTVTVLSPQPAPLPTKIFLIGDIKLRNRYS